MAVDASRPPLTPREQVVYNLIKRSCARNHMGYVPARFVGSAGTCRALINKGYIIRELSSIGPNGGRYYRYALRPGTEPEEAVEITVQWKDDRSLAWLVSRPPQGLQVNWGSLSSSTKTIGALVPRSHLARVANELGALRLQVDEVTHPVVS